MKKVPVFNGYGLDITAVKNQWQIWQPLAHKIRVKRDGGFRNGRFPDFVFDTLSLLYYEFRQWQNQIIRL